MKNKILFLLPRIAGITIVVGVAALILGFLFKLLLGVTLLGLLAAGVYAIVSNVRKQHGNNNVGLPTRNNLNERSWEQPHYNYSNSQKTIVPIN